MGRLTTDQKTAIRAGNPIRQVWHIYVPVDSAHSAFSATKIEAGIFPMESVGNSRVLRAGQRSHIVWNPTPNVKKSPKAVRYSFIVDNSDGRFFENNAENFYKYGATYQAVPQECYIKHQLYIASYSYTGITWSELTHMAYEGVIADLRHEDTADPKGNVVGAQTTIMCEQKGAWDILRRSWTIDDAVEVPMTNGVIADYEWSIP